jgi:hypothetical protein
VSMICGSDGILAKPTNDNGKIANGSALVAPGPNHILAWLAYDWLMCQ